jgi:hypothetical protein
MPADTDPCKIVEGLYRGVDGFTLSSDEIRRLGGRTSLLIYGELTPNGVGTMLDYLRLGRRDVFYDLGSGVGKVVIQTALTVPLKKCVGIELARSRCHGARSVLASVRQTGLLKTSRCTFRNEDILHADFADATALYCCSTVFSAWLMRRLARKIAAIDGPLVFISMQSLSSQARRIRLIDEIRLSTTWNPSARAWVYRVERRDTKS